MEAYDSVSTGINGFDKAIDMLRLGDNVVWQVDSIECYKYVVDYYVLQAKIENRNLVYIRFGEHEPVIDDFEGIKVYELNPYLGFEDFAMTVHNIIKNEGEEIFYVFDSLTDLQQCWCSELMTNNFFKVISPYLHKLNNVSYFTLIRNDHTYDTISSIRESTELLLDIYEVEDDFYIHPIKVWQRYSPTMFFPQKIKDNYIVPITSSADTAELFSTLDLGKKRLGYWRRTFNKAKNSLDADLQTKEKMKELLINILVGRNSKIYDMCMKHFDLSDVVQIASREIGTGFIGGKSIGMLLATEIIKKSKEYKERFSPLLEMHDSFYIGADVFYSYIVENGMWDLRIKQKTKEGYFEYSKEFKERLESGYFSKMLEDRFVTMLEYYGQSPIIVRSSSLLEDNFGNAFAGKYESVFCVNQGTLEERLKEFENAVKTVYASTMNEDALNYRKIRGLDQKDEQMAILVQRVSGDYYGEYFFPHIAGVGNSSNLYVWNNRIDMDAGMLRMVFGLGTRAVDRVNNDYVRIVPLDNPTSMPRINYDDRQKFSQHYVDLLNLQTNELSTVYVNDVLKSDVKTNVSILGTKDNSSAPFILDFQNLLKNTGFPKVMRKVLSILSDEYNHPVDIEFTANFNEKCEFKFNIVQCRPLQTRGLGKKIELPKFLDENSCLFSSVGNFMGGNIRLPIDYIVFVDAKEYIKLSETDKYSIARQIGIINEVLKDENTMLMGPGRWGSRNPQLGVPIRFTELCHMSVMCEIAYSSERLMPELSYGSHFFQDLVETGIFYVALFDNKNDVVFNQDKLVEGKNIVNDIVKNNIINEGVIKVYYTKGMEIYSDITEQIVTCY